MKKSKLRLIPMFVFLVFVFSLTAMFFILPKKEYSSSEKRYLQQAPAFSFEDLFSGKFGDEFETFLSDQFGFRNFWVGLSSYYQLAIGNNGSTGIYFGKNDYLLNDPCGDGRLTTNTEVIAEFAAKHPDIPTTVLIAPSTGYVCPDVLPAVHKEYKDDAYFEMFREKLTSVDFVDVRERFQNEYENGHQIYYKTDHHWTSYGAYTAYQELAAAMGFTANSQDAYEKTSYPGFYGTTYSSSSFWLNPPDDIEVWENHAHDGKIKVTVTEGADVTENDDLFFYSHLEEDDKYPVFLDGNHAYETIENTAASSDEKLLVIKDSFAHSLVPFLSDHYASITMIDMRYYKQNVSQLIEQEGFDRILFIYSVDNLSSDTDLVWLE
ncbi:MAG: hypothetical protein IJH32_04550 [Ruminococcus sp.]|nr:hypothetical protein [Ruminococcus sp.]